MDSTLPQVADHVTAVSACIVAENLDRTADWYRDALGLELLSRLDIPDRGERVAFIGRGNVLVELSERRGSAGLRRADPPEHSHVQGPSHLSLRVDALDPVLAELTLRGVPTAVGPVDIAPLALRVAFVRDNEGNLIEFVQDARS